MKPSVKYEPDICEGLAVTKFDLDEHLASSNQPTIPTTKRGSLQLWQFLLHLLSTKAPPHGEPIIEWTRKSAAEFKLLDPEEVARLWGIQKNRPTMNYDKLSRSLRYYYEKGTVTRINPILGPYLILIFARHHV